MNGQRAARAYDARTGKELWRCGGQTERPCASAVAADGTAFIAAVFEGAFLAAFKLDWDRRHPRDRKRFVGPSITILQMSLPIAVRKTGSTSTKAGQDS